MAGIHLGELLVEQGVLSPEQVEAILREQRSCPRPFGELAETLYGIDPRAIEDAWVEQYVRVSGVVDLEDIEIDADALRQINRRQAWQFHMLPTGRDELTLNVATDADHLVKAVNFATRTLPDPVYFMIAERRQLREFLMRHYPVPGFMADYAARR